MRIALLYRGQLRSGCQSYHCVNRFKKRYRNNDIKVFCHATDTISVSNNSDDYSTIKNVPPYSQTKISNDFFEKMISQFNPDMARLDNDNIARSLSADIISKLDSRYYMLYEKGLSKPYSIDYLSYMMSQFVNAAKSFHMLNEYVEEKDWIPDLIIHLRYDTAFLVHNLPIIDDHRALLSKGILVTPEGMILSDTMFVSSYYGFASYYKNFNQKLIDVMIDFRSIGFHHDPLLQHFIWMMLCQDNIFLQSLDFDSAIIRPGNIINSNFSLDDIRKHAGTWNQIRAHK